MQCKTSMKDNDTGDMVYEYKGKSNMFFVSFMQYGLKNTMKMTYGLECIQCT